ncbi:protein-export membrane protein SecF [Candidatus Gottesmanbacteria bacterium RIFCSPLOWO2_01_FULL_49_10]|uniref:Protein-export membrane protein SecF n=1 Tax=Candidatus Gottesmanbacteria bacterium RIFCSPLOWO2_01_FULL_49_10 TaxID=1798396 RepID=A0A1F6B1E5_9BACT|nr:MAG: SecF protein [Microgenomates group bacterium GW2011_GWA2_47_8]OGG30751.1 MAG: protein-export membrane protein SecF [Candidatus Gottesmanbacteria bacterium RIFCSPLOWO2_01_FULL_49_10]
MIRFSKYLWLYALISLFVLVPGVYSLVRYGLRPGIDFTGGTLLELSFGKTLPEETIRSSLERSGIPFVGFQTSGTSVLVRIKPEGSESVLQFQKEIERSASVAATVDRNETVGPILGSELLVKATFAAILAILVILAYVAYAFRNIKFGISAVIALIHDLLVVLGVFSLLGHMYAVEVDTLFVTAFLTTMSFSVHDTIVVFDRIREYRKKDDKTSFEQLSDRALTETMGRSLTNSLTIIFMLLALILLGGETIKWFIVALLVGTVSGTYSSPFIATPVLLLWDRWEKRRVKSGK